MMRTALKKLGCVREETAIIGDRMDTDILAGVETEMDTVLVLSGVTSPEEIDTYAYRPKIDNRVISEKREKSGRNMNVRFFYIDRKTNINYICSECITHFKTFL